MAYTVADVESWIGVDAGSLDADLMARVKSAVDLHAARFYDLAAPTDEHDQALIMQAARLYRRKHAQNGTAGTDDRGSVVVTRFDPDVRDLLEDRLITAGLFGPSANVVTEE